MLTESMNGLEYATMKPIRHTRRLIRGNPFLKERMHDPYRSMVKLSEFTQCPDCGVQCRKGRWVWPKAGAAGRKRQTCPACRRIKDRFPAGEVVLSGSFLTDHCGEIVSRIRDIERSECSGHPLHRIISVDDKKSHIKITTTDIHLPHRIGHALTDAFGGTTETHYDRDGCFARVRWNRDS